MKNINKENRIIIKHFRVTEEEDKKILKDAQDSKSPSDYIRHKLGLGKNEN